MNELTKQLNQRYPMEAAYNSRATVYGAALRDKVITKEQYDAAKGYYAGLWQYTGD